MDKEVGSQLTRYLLTREEVIFLRRTNSDIVLGIRQRGDGSMLLSYTNSPDGQSLQGQLEQTMRSARFPITERAVPRR